MLIAERKINKNHFLFANSDKLSFLVFPKRLDCFVKRKRVISAFQNVLFLMLIIILTPGAIFTKLLRQILKNFVILGINI
jgi:hypothetical protein